MRLNHQKRLASNIFKCSPKKVKFAVDKLTEIKEGITKTDIRKFIGLGFINKVSPQEISRGRARKLKSQKRKNLRKGQGSRKGKSTARLSKKERWMAKIRLQRLFLKELRNKSLVDIKTYRILYRKASGGSFRSKKHLKMYMEDHSLFKK